MIRVYWSLNKWRLDRKIRLTTFRFRNQHLPNYTLTLSDLQRHDRCLWLAASDQRVRPPHLAGSDLVRHSGSFPMRGCGSVKRSNSSSPLTHFRPNLNSSLIRLWTDRSPFSMREDSSGKVSGRWSLLQTSRLQCPCFDLSRHNPVVGPLPILVLFQMEGCKLALMQVEPEKYIKEIRLLATKLPGSVFSCISSVNIPHKGTASMFEMSRQILLLSSSGFKEIEWCWSWILQNWHWSQQIGSLGPQENKWIKLFDARNWPMRTP